jgi:DNA-binding beta-propeller fold protein YncE
MSPTGDAAYITLMAVGKLLKLDPKTGDVIGEAQVGPRPRGIAVSHDGKDVYVTRFISPDTGGEVVKVDAAAMTVATRIVLKLDKETEDNDQRARGFPNYLFSVALTPDGRQAWIPGKKDNIVRGKLRDGRDITHDTTVRPLAAIVDTQSRRRSTPAGSISTIAASRSTSTSARTATSPS